MILKGNFLNRTQNVERIKKNFDIFDFKIKKKYIDILS